jgi:hypothetical protein
MHRSKLFVIAALGIFMGCQAASEDPLVHPTDAAEGTDDAGDLPTVDENDVIEQEPVLETRDTTPTGGVMPASAPPTATFGDIPVWAHFANPVAGGGEDATIMNELIRLLDATPAGATVRGNIFSISVTKVLEAYARAKTRGVKFQITHSGHDAASVGGMRLGPILKEGHEFCGAATPGKSNGCISTASTSIAHIKFLTFSQTTDPQGVARSNVAWWGSANQTVSSGMRLFNNTLTVYGDKVLFDTLNAHADAMWAQRHYTSNDYYDSATPRGYVHSPATKTSLYMSPEQQTDLWDARLNDITPDDKCEVRVIHASIRDSRPAVTNRLIALKAGGCKVMIASDDVEPKALAALHRAGIPVRRQVIHDKTVLHYSRMSGGSDYRYHVLTGSHNWSNGALRQYDELLSRTESKPLYDAFVGHFNDVYNAGTSL